MNLIEEIKKNIVTAYLSPDGDYNEETMLYADVVNKIALQYAIEMCKRQRELCTNALASELFLGDATEDLIPILQTVKNAPLATEE